jgi:hypothetical protein
VTGCVPSLSSVRSLRSACCSVARTAESSFATAPSLAPVFSSVLVVLRDGLPSQTMSRRLMSTESVGVDVSVVASGVMPHAPRSAVGVAGSILPLSCIIPALPSLRVSPYEHHNRWLCLDSVSDVVSQGPNWMLKK